MEYILLILAISCWINAFRLDIKNNAVDSSGFYGLAAGFAVSSVLFVLKGI